MISTPLKSWNEWRRRCAIAKCEPESIAALSHFAGEKFKYFASTFLGQMDVEADIPNPRACFDLLEHWMSVARPRSGRRYKEWLFTRAGNSAKGTKAAMINSGASLLLRSVVRKWLADFGRYSEISLDTPIPEARETSLLDLIPDEHVPAVEENMMREIADALANDVFQTMERPIRLVMLARMQKLPLYHPRLLKEFGFGKTKAADVWKDVFVSIAGRITEKWPDETVSWKTELALCTSDAINQLLLNSDPKGRKRAYLAELARA